MVNLKFINESNVLVAAIEGEIDHHTAENLRERIDEAILVFKPQTIILDFERVTFMDSSGVGLVMGRFRMAKYYGGKVVISVPEGRIRKLLMLSGLKELVEFKGGKNEEHKQIQTNN